MLTERQKLEIQQLVITTEKEYKKRLRKNGSHVYAINLVSDLHSKIDNLVSSVKDQGVRFGCENGCSHCCNLRVEALAPEVFYIAKQIKCTASKDELGKLIETLQTFSAKAKALTMEEHLITCPMLSEGKCTIYKFRPMMCRKFNSLEAEVCEDPYAEVPEHMEIVMKSGAIGHSFNSALENKKLSSIPHELGQALLVALTDDVAEKRWSKGQQVFELLPEM